MSKNNRCPKCNTKLSPFYMKQNCPNCNINLLYYRMDERLASDAERARRETDAVKRFLTMLKDSTIASAWHIVRLVLFFLPLGSMCLPMFRADHKNVSLITLIMTIVNHGLHIDAWSTDYLIANLAIAMVIVLSLVCIIMSLFSAGKRGYRRNSICSIVNTLVFGLLATFACKNGAEIKLGFYLTLLIYAIEMILHYAIAKPKTSNKKKVIAVSLALCIVLCDSAFILSREFTQNAADSYSFVENYDTDISVVSFNVASAFGTKFEDTDSMDRCKRFVDYMSTVHPSLIGTQEMNIFWLDYIKDNLDGYTVYGVKRGGDSEDKNSEMNAIIWNSDAFTELEKNTFWLSETPDVESKYTYIDDEGNDVEAGCNRICSYAVLQSDNGTVLFMNTHLDNSSEQARSFGASVILEKMEELRSKYNGINVVLTGDFNEYADSEACVNISKVLNNTTYDMEKKATYQEWGYANTGSEPIDFIFTSGEGVEYRVLDDLSQGYVSDHFGIYSAINY